MEVLNMPFGKIYRIFTYMSFVHKFSTRGRGILKICDKLIFLLAMVGSL